MRYTASGVGGFWQVSSIVDGAFPFLLKWGERTSLSQHLPCGCVQASQFYIYGTKTWLWNLSVLTGTVIELYITTILIFKKGRGWWRHNFICCDGMVMLGTKHQRNQPKKNTQLDSSEGRKPTSSKISGATHGGIPVWGINLGWDVCRSINPSID